MKTSKKLIAITILIFALYYWYIRFDVITHPEFYGELILPTILSIVGVYLLTSKSKKK